MHSTYFESVLGKFKWKQFGEDGWQHPKVRDRLTMIAETQSANVLLVQSNTLDILEIDNTPPS